MTAALQRLLLWPSALLIAGAALYAARGSRHESSQTKADDSPQACIVHLLAAEERGDSRAYLECFCLARREELEALWKDRQRSQVEAELRGRFAGVVGRAITDLKFADTEHAKLVLERISKDRTERQHVQLVRDGGRWRIAALSAPDWQTPDIPYGTPVFTPR